MGKFLMLLIAALAVVGGSIYFGVLGGTATKAAVEEPTRQLEHVRVEAKKIEDDAQKRADDLAAKLGSAGK